MESNSASRKQKNNALIMFSGGLSIGTGLGISLGVAFGNIPLGLSLGAGAGIAIGMGLYQYFLTKPCNKD